MCICHTKEQVERQIAFQPALPSPLSAGPWACTGKAPLEECAQIHTGVDMPFTTTDKCHDEGQPAGCPAPQRGSTSLIGAVCWLREFFLQEVPSD